VGWQVVCFAVARLLDSARDPLINPSGIAASIVCRSVSEAHDRARADALSPCSWCTWYGIPCFPLHKKSTHHWQLRSIAVCCGPPKTPVMLPEFEKVQVGSARVNLLPR
jgi:hypothetical protein